MNERVLRGVVTALVVFVAVQAGALALVGPFDAAGYRAVEDPSDPTNSLVYLLAVLVATGLLLAAFKYDFRRAVRWLIVGASVLLAWHVFSVVVPPWVPAAGPVAVVLSVGVGGALLTYPEWYVIDTAGVLMGAGAAGLFGISFGLLPAVVLLVVLALYDALSVYGTEHMLDLAEGVMDLRLPVVLVIPVTGGYSLFTDDFAGANDVFEDSDDGSAAADAPGAGREPDLGSRQEPNATGETESPTEGGTNQGASQSAGDEPADGDGSSPADRGALFVGLGDAVIPTVMVASAASFSPADPLGLPLLSAANLPALGAAGGSLLGLLALLWLVFRGRAHAGLPLLNGGAVAGYLLGSVAAGVSPPVALGIAAAV